MAVGPLKTDNGEILSSNVIMEDTETITLEDFSYDGTIPGENLKEKNFVLHVYVFREQYFF